MLELRDVVKEYPAGDEETVRPLDGVSWTIESATFAALYGPSGSGKTTLLQLIAAELAPDRGQVLVDGRDVSGLSGRDAALYRRQQLGYLSQSAELIPGVSALDNAALRLLMTMSARTARRRVTPLLERLGLGKRLHHRPSELSAGERQRVLLALALSAGPALVLADEPTGNLDAARSDEVFALLQEVCAERNVALLLATHDPAAIAYADTVRELRDGRLHDALPSPTGRGASG